MLPLIELLAQTARLHHHLCPRQVLGVRMGLYAGQLLELDLPQSDKQLFVIAETDGCGVDGISVATNCWIGRRTLRVEDYGKLAATFVDTQTEQAVRIVPRPSARERARQYAPAARSRWEAQLLGYQQLPDEELFSAQPVRLSIDLRAILSHAGLRAVCDLCGEEIMNEREIKQADLTLCRSCAQGSYYQIVADFAIVPLGVER
ncbi:formylmethanofuran dehydrogenase subunit E [Thermoflexales bacterium]|nr:formylmethanofuran dehydrogenase subunit E [Thermoflexales bacterium]